MNQYHEINTNRINQPTNQSFNHLKSMIKDIHSNTSTDTHQITSNQISQTDHTLQNIQQQQQQKQI